MGDQMTTFYIAATDRMSWGRGTRKWEAIGHAISYGGDKVKSIALYEVSCVTGTSETEVSVNETGNIVAPKGSEVKELNDRLDANNMVRKFFAFYSSIE